MKSAIIAFVLNFTALTQAKEIITLSNAEKVAQNPAACLDRKDLCSFKTSKDEKFKFKFGENQIILDENTALIRMNEKQLVLVSGQIWVKATDEVVVQTEYGTATASNASFLARNFDKKMDIKAIDGELILKPKMSLGEIKLEAGEQNWLGPIDKNRVATSGVPLPIRPSELVVSWSRLYTGTKTQFESDFKNFFVLWSGASERLAKLHKEITQRQIANIENEIERKKKIKADRDREDRRIKDWFRKRSLSD